MKKIPRKPVENVGGVDFNPVTHQKQAQTLIKRMDKKRKQVLDATLLTHRYRMLFRRDY